MLSNSLKNHVKPTVDSFFHKASSTISYVVSDPMTRKCAIIDPVLDFDYSSGSIFFEHAHRLMETVTKRGLSVDRIIETHIHADHLSSAPYIKDKIGGQLCISKEIISVQKIFGKVYNAGTDFELDGSQFDILLGDNENYEIGELGCKALATPGHTPACMAHLIGDSVFVGDTLFMPDGGTARADFPGGNAEELYNSIQKILGLPDQTRLFVCHDYAPNQRSPAWETTVEEQRRENIHVGGEVNAKSFVKLRKERDKTLPAPELMIPSIQVNIRAGKMPPEENNGVTYLKVPIKLGKTK